MEQKDVQKMKCYGRFVQYLAELIEKYGTEVLVETQDANELEARYSTDCGR